MRDKPSDERRRKLVEKIQREILDPQRGVAATPDSRPSNGYAAKCESEYRAELQALIAAHEAFTRWMNAVIAAKPHTEKAQPHLTAKKGNE